MAAWSQIHLSEGISILGEGIIAFHDYMMMLLCVILVFVVYLLLAIISSNSLDSLLLENHSMEIVWTLLPMVFLILMAYPSLLMLFYMESMEFSTTEWFYKVVAHQWYWEYEILTPQGNHNFNANLVLEYKEAAKFYPLDSDNSLYVPTNQLIELLVTSSDVLHSWTVPGMGVKVDAVPGRLNVLHSVVSLEGVYYGQCSEICGANHSFMPITVNSIHL